MSGIHNFDDQFGYQLKKLDETNIEDRDRQASREFIRYQDAQRGLAASNNIHNCSDFRPSTSRALLALAGRRHRTRRKALRQAREATEGGALRGGQPYSFPAGTTSTFFGDLIPRQTITKSRPGVFPVCPASRPE